MQKYVSEKKLETQQNHETSVQKAFPVKSKVAIKLMLSFFPIPSLTGNLYFGDTSKVSFAMLCFYKPHTESNHTTLF